MCLWASHSYTAHVCVSLCVCRVCICVSVVWGVARRGDRTRVCTQRQNTCKMCGSRSAQPVLCHSDRKPPAPEVPQGELDTVSEIPTAPLSLLWASALWRKGLKKCNSVLKEGKDRPPDWVYQIVTLAFKYGDRAWLVPGTAGDGKEVLSSWKEGS